MIRTGLLTGLFVLVAACAVTKQDVHSQDKAILDDLRSGGFVIFFTHAAAEDFPSTTTVIDLNDCATQPRLNGLGRTQAKVIGKSMKKLKIPVGNVFASEYCLCLDTAKLAFGYATPAVDITLSTNLEEDAQQRNVSALNNMLAQQPLQGVNTVIIGHASMLKSARKIELQEGDAAIFKPDGDGSTALISQVKANGWQTLVSRVYDPEQ